MKQNIEIEVPEGFEVKYDPKTQKIEFFKKSGVPRTWEEYCKTNLVRQGEAYINPSGSIAVHNPNLFDEFERKRKNWCVSYEEAEAFLALMQLRQLRKAWVKDWEPVWFENLVKEKYCIVNSHSACVAPNFHNYHSLSFPTEEMAKEFLTCFKDLIEKAKILL